MKQFRVARYHVKLNKPDMKPGNFRLVFLTDLHNCEWEQDNRLLLSMIEEQKPDLVLCGGDMLVAHPGESPEVAVSFLTELAKRHRIWYAPGNHEYRLRLYPETYGDMYQQYRKALKDADIVFLNHSSAELTVCGVPVTVYGLHIARKYYQRLSRLKMPVSCLNDQLGQPDPARVNLLLAHTPKYMKTYLEWGADLSLSGHYHGGVLRTRNGKGLISPDPQLLPDNAHGGFVKDGKYAIVSAGLGEHTIPFRIRNPREIVAVKVTVH